MDAKKSLKILHKYFFDFFEPVCGSGIELQVYWKKCKDY